MRNEKNRETHVSVCPSSKLHSILLLSFKDKSVSVKMLKRSKKVTFSRTSGAQIKLVTIADFSLYMMSFGNIYNISKTEKNCSSGRSRRNILKSRVRPKIYIYVVPVT